MINSIDSIRDKMKRLYCLEDYSEEVYGTDTHTITLYGTANGQRFDVVSNQTGTLRVYNIIEGNLEDVCADIMETCEEDWNIKDPRNIFIC